MLSKINELDEYFCQIYVATRNEGFSYRVAFDPQATVTSPAHSRAAQGKINDACIMQRIVEMRKKQEEAETATLPEIFNRWLAMATADPDELIGLRIGACRYCHGADHGYHWKAHEYEEELRRYERNVRGAKNPTDYEMPDIAGGFGYDHTSAPHPRCPECRGEGVQRIVARDTSQLSPQAKLLYGGVEQTSKGFKIIIADRVKALENVTRMLGGFKDDASVRGNVINMANIINLASDPQAAERAYMDMIKKLNAG